MSLRIVISGWLLTPTGSEKLRLVGTRFTVKGVVILMSTKTPGMEPPTMITSCLPAPFISAASTKPGVNWKTLSLRMLRTEV